MGQKATKRKDKMARLSSELHDRVAALAEAEKRQIGAQLEVVVEKGLEALEREAQEKEAA